MSRLRPRSVYDVLAVIGCFAALTTGSAYAINTIGSADIIDGEVKAADIGTNQVLGSRVVDETIKSADLANNQVKGADVDESSLATVPRAASVPDGSITRAKRATAEGWHFIGDAGEPAFQNGWGNYSAESSHHDATWPHAGYRKDNEGVVHLTGLITDGDLDTTAFRLPAGYCPWHVNAFPVVANDTYGRITVFFELDGCDVRIDLADTQENGKSDWVALDGIHFLEGDLDRRDANAPLAQGRSASSRRAR